MDTTKTGKFLVDKDGFSYWSPNGDTASTEASSESG